MEETEKVTGRLGKAKQMEKLQRKENAKLTVERLWWWWAQVVEI